ncbi:lytic transglycosylase domain-containing protein [Escherichia coli]|nr:transglycosylase [Escherichia coli]EGE6785377.1 lytic transglycosylase domain-containing protein [Escherichia coli]EKS5461606.1 lytic transglycosylase domain-containing protein [Escherichia coli]ELF2677500.1 lytic transglycosylase domain-containing protein [Escherichia coli]
MSILTTGAFLALAAQCAPNVHPDTSLDVVRVESGLHQYAIAEIIPKNERVSEGKSFISHYPESKDEAVKIIRRIEERKRKYSVGLMQINSLNFEKLRVTATELLDPCSNLKAYQYIITDCYLRGGSLTNALSCYYSGNFITGRKVESELNNTSYIQRIGFSGNDYVVPGTREQIDEIKNKSRNNIFFESWDVLREYPKQLNRYESKETEVFINEKNDRAV